MADFLELRILAARSLAIELEHDAQKSQDAALVLRHLLKAIGLGDLDVDTLDDGNVALALVCLIVPVPSTPFMREHNGDIHIYSRAVNQITDLLPMTRRG